MTTDLLPQQPPPMPSHPRRRDGKAPLPAPEVRAGLRLSWHLSEQQVAAAFGVTPATVRSWEAGRTTPTGQRRAAYAAFLSGLAQGLAPGARRSPAGPRAAGGGVARKRPAATVPEAPRPAAPVPVPAPPRAPAPIVAPSPGPDPVRTAAASPGRAPAPAPGTAAGPHRARDLTPVPVTPAPAGAARVRILPGAPAPRPAGLPVAGGPDPVSAARRHRFRLAAVAAGVWLIFVHLMVTTAPAQASGAAARQHGTAAGAAPGRP
ncbi:helix-turn-helix domain-containing protein [Streptomyces sp. NPDC048566]|uniref:helix-turn-helix domain-containing protein n=1 Tax=Streptomyces sp. NPDC048566 TaxID=3365569 RepID=UPI003724330F